MPDWILCLSAPGIAILSGTPMPLSFWQGFKKDIFKVGLSYDLTVSGLAGRSGGTYELTFGILFDKNERLRKKKQHADINNCLRMFQ